MAFIFIAPPCPHPSPPHRPPPTPLSPCLWCRTRGQMHCLAGRCQALCVVAPTATLPARRTDSTFPILSLKKLLFVPTHDCHVEFSASKLNMVTVRPRSRTTLITGRIRSETTSPFISPRPAISNPISDSFVGNREPIACRHTIHQLRSYSNPGNI